MNSDERKSLIRFLIFQLRERSLDVIAYRAVFLNLDALEREEMMKLWKLYRSSEPIQLKLEKEFHGLDELVEQLEEAPDLKALQTLLERFSPDGEPN